MKTYKIDYEIYFKNGTHEHKKPMKIHNCIGELHAKVRLEEFLKKKYPKFEKLVVFSCKDDINMKNFFDMFGSNNLSK